MRIQEIITSFKNQEYRTYCDLHKFNMTTDGVPLIVCICINSDTHFKVLELFCGDISQSCSGKFPRRIGICRLAIGLCTSVSFIHLMAMKGHDYCRRMV